MAQAEKKQKKKVEPIIFTRQEDYPFALEIPHIMGIMGCGQRQAYEKCNQQERSENPKFPVRRIGIRGIRVPRDPFFAWWNSLEKKPVDTKLRLAR